MNLFEVFLKGGYLMWPILLASLIALEVIINKFIVLHRAQMNVSKFMITIRNFIKKKDIDGAVSHCLAEKTPVANIVRKGLKKYPLGHERVKEAIENAGKQEVVRLEKGLSILATVAGIAPLLGFLGTVTGMIAAFQRIQDLQGAASPSDLAGGIWEALLTTAFGLAVGIPALLFYNYFVGRVNKMVSEMELVSNEVADTVEEVSLGVKTPVSEFDPDDL